MNVCYLEFCVDDSPVETTLFYNDPHGALEEAVRRRDEILELLNCYTKTITFDKTLPPDAPENKAAIEWFDYWTSDLVLWQLIPGQVQWYDIDVNLHCMKLQHYQAPAIHELVEAS